MLGSLFQWLPVKYSRSTMPSQFTAFYIAFMQVIPAASLSRDSGYYYRMVTGQATDHLTFALEPAPAFSLEIHIPAKLSPCFQCSPNLKHRKNIEKLPIYHPRIRASVTVIISAESILPFRDSQTTGKTLHTSLVLHLTSKDCSLN